MKNKNFGRKRQAIYILSNRKSTRIIKTLMDFFFFIKVKIKMVCFSVPSIKSKEVIQMDINSLAHTKWNCKYHIVFAPKYRRKVAYGKMKQDIANILSMLCKRKSVEIVEAEICPDHVHMLVKIPPSLSVSSFVGYLKGKSTLMIFERHANLKYKYGNRHFWCRGHYVDTVGKNAKKIQEYIQNQLQNDLEYDQMTLKEYIAPFTGEPVNQNK